MKRLKKASLFLKHLLKLKYVIILAIVSMCFGWISMVDSEHLKKITGGIAPLDMQFTYSSNKVLSIIKAMGSPGRIYYEKWLFFDFIVAIVAMFFQIILISYLIYYVNHNSKLYLLNCFPCVKLLFDYLENCFILYSLYLFPENNIIIAKSAGYLTFLKWSSLICTALILVVLFIMAVYKRFESSNKDRVQ